MGVTKLLLVDRYPTFQVTLDVFSEKLSDDDVFKKTLLYAMVWIKKRVGMVDIETKDEFSIFRNFPAVAEYEKLNFEDLKSYTELNLTDIRIFYMESDDGKERDWAFRIVEPDNGSEGKVHAGRSFTTDIALHQDSSGVTLGCRVEARQSREDNSVASVFRLAFIKDIFRDEDLKMVEHGLDRVYAFNGKSIHITTHQECKEVCDGLLKNKNVQLPVILCPEVFGSVKQKLEVFHDGKLQTIDGGVDDLASELVGFGHVVVLDEKEYNKFFYTNLDNKDQIFYNVIVDKHKPYFYIPFKEYSGADMNNNYLDDIIAASDETLDEILNMLGDGPEMFAEEQDFQNMLSLSINYQRHKSFNYAPCLFYRSLRSKYFEETTSEDANDKIAFYENRINELQERINGFQTNTDNQNRKINEDQKHIKELNDLNKVLEKKNSNLEERIAQKEREFSEYVRTGGVGYGKNFDEVTADMRRLFGSGNVGTILEFQDLYGKAAPIVKDEILEILKKKYDELLFASKKQVTRRREVIAIVLEYAKENPSNTGIYYPRDLDFCENEIRDIAQDVLFDCCKQEGDHFEWLYELLLENDFDEAQAKKKRRFNDLLKGVLEMEKIKPILTDYDWVEGRHEGHPVYFYHGEKRFKYTFASTPSDFRATKNGSHIMADIAF